MNQENLRPLSAESLISELPMKLPDVLLRDGRCTVGDRDPRLWDLALDGEGPASRHNRRNRGARLCRTECTVRARCLRFAQETRRLGGPEMLTGVWGGIVFSEREQDGREGDRRFLKETDGQILLKLPVPMLYEHSSF